MVHNFDKIIISNTISQHTPLATLQQVIINEQEGLVKAMGKLTEGTMEFFINHPDEDIIFADVATGVRYKITDDVLVTENNGLINIQGLRLVAPIN